MTINTQTKKDRTERLISRCLTYARNPQVASARALRSLLNLAKSLDIFLPNKDGPIKNDRGPLRSSHCVNMVADPSWAGSIRNECKPDTVKTGGPFQENVVSEFSSVRDELLALNQA